MFACASSPSASRLLGVRLNVIQKKCKIYMAVCSSKKMDEAMHERDQIGIEFKKTIS